MQSAAEPRATGRCLCGAVSYEVRGLLRDVVLCHCSECRRWSGTGAGAFAAAHDTDLQISGDALRWIDSPDSKRNARRGFCVDCGTSLFWKSPELERTGIAAGTLDEPTGVRVAAHIYTHQTVDWDALPDDGLPRDPETGTLELRWT
ncbi:MAG TPA: GFA family protein [Gaiellaceae bacterium]|nr:GFA family protein [Gaiellaceae bacterium]